VTFISTRVPACPPAAAHLPACLPACLPAWAAPATQTPCALPVLCYTMLQNSASVGLVVMGENELSRPLLIHRISREITYQRQGGEWAWAGMGRERRGWCEAGLLVWRGVKRSLNVAWPHGPPAALKSVLRERGRVQCEVCQHCCAWACDAIDVREAGDHAQLALSTAGSAHVMAAASS